MANQQIIIEKQVNLQPFNTFGIAVTASHFVSVSSTEMAQQLVTRIREDTDLQKLPRMILGGGSNILLTGDFDGLIIHNQIKGISVIAESEQEVVVCVGAGESWHELVLYAIGKGWGGIENLSLIPGTVGAAPMQNIGAYGAEIKDVFVSLAAVHLQSGDLVTFNKEDCQFGYRQSIFKTSHRDQYMICTVTLRLSKQPEVNISYGAISETLRQQGIENPGIRDVSQAVIAIRQSKLPDPAQIGNAGSFFKNPTISNDQFERLKASFPDIVGYPNNAGVKVPAGWLIEHAGWKGQTKGNVGVHKNQALVLVNYGGGEGRDIYQLSEEIKQSVREKYGITLEREVNVV